MRSIIKNREGKYNRKIMLVIFVFTAFLLYYLIMSITGSCKKVSSVKDEYGFKKDTDKNLNEKILPDSAYIMLQREKSFLQARITMAGTDSICLSINLPDSLAILEIKGISVYRAKISHISASRFFYRADEYSVTSLLAHPFIIKRDFSTIEKEPLMLKIAPRDTSEYKPDIVPDTSYTEPVHFILEAANGFRFYISQNPENGREFDFNRFLFSISGKFRNIGENIKSILLLRIPEYYPSVRIYLDKKDARIIYRAIPRKCQVALYR